MRKAVALAALAVVLGTAGARCDGGEDPIKIGLLADCSGLLGQTKEIYIAGATLPFVERGGERVDGGGGARGAEVGGRPVELVAGCTEVTYAHLLMFAARRLVEEERVDVLVGPIGAPESVVFREIASRYPDVTFVSGVSIAQESTLRDSQPNHFRFMPDGPQIAAGLGTYAYRDLGWRRATVVAEPFAEGWELSAGFVAEFCALGGQVERDFTSLLTPGAAATAARRAAETDGVLLAVDFVSAVPYLSPYAAIVGGDVARRLLLVGSAFFDPGNLEPPGADLDGTVVGGYIPLDPRVASMQRYAESFTKAFPELPAGSAFNPVVVPVSAAVDAVLAALEEVDGNLGPRQERFRDVLAATRRDMPFGPLRLDRNRQAAVSSYLERVTHRDGVVGTAIVRAIPDVDQTYGGIFTATSPSPSWAEPACVKRTPPPWAR